MRCISVQSLFATCVLISIALAGRPQLRKKDPNDHVLYVTQWVSNVVTICPKASAASQNHPRITSILDTASTVIPSDPAIASTGILVQPASHIPGTGTTKALTPPPASSNSPGKYSYAFSGISTSETNPTPDPSGLVPPGLPTASSSAYFSETSVSPRAIAVISSSSSSSSGSSKTTGTEASRSSASLSSSKPSSTPSQPSSKYTSSSLTSSKSSSLSISKTGPTSTTSSKISRSSSPSSSRSTASTSMVSSASTSSRSSVSSSTAPTQTSCAYWLESFKHQGIASFNSNPGTYTVFRNVKDFGAKGDGVTDDTAAINAAITNGARCAPGSCQSSTTTPALVYFPAGTYIVSSPIIDYYYTQIIGNPNCVPIIKASATFTARWVIDGDVYQAGGALGYGATNVFWRQIRNLVIDITSIPPSVNVAGIHWPTAQATSLQNILFKMSTASGNLHEGLFIESGSGGFMNDLTFYGGQYGMEVGNQQFTMRNLTFFNAVTAISQLWDWGWTYKGISINNCSVGIDMSGLNNGAQSVGSVTLIDSVFANTPIAVKMARDANSQPPTGGSLIIENVGLTNVPVVVKGPSGTVLAGSSGVSMVTAWGQGHSYTSTGPTTFQGPIAGNTRPTSLTAGSDFYERSKPQYANLPVSSFISVRTAGAKGDGVTDDSNVLIAVFASAASSGKIVFFDAGYYLVTKSIYIPAGCKITGESYPVIMSSGSFFADKANPQPVVQVGKSGESGNVEWSDMIVSTQGPQAGAILIEWNLASPPSSPSGIWDVHTRIGGFAGSKLQVANCPVTSSTVTTTTNLATSCIAAFMSMHITKSGSGLYMENVWLWVADHDVEDPSETQITIYAGRGLLIESSVGGIWLVGTAAEHHVLYQYQFSSTTAIFAGQVQTETAYYQPNPDATIPFPALPVYNDPVIASGGSGWALRILSSNDILIYGAGLYSFFSNNNVHCSDQGNGETCQKSIFSVKYSSGVKVYNLNTVGAESMFTLNGTDVANYADNLNGFIDTIAMFRV